MDPFQRPVLTVPKKRARHTSEAFPPESHAPETPVTTECPRADDLSSSAVEARPPFNRFNNVRPDIGGCPPTLDVCGTVLVEHCGCCGLEFSDISSRGAHFAPHPETVYFHCACRAVFAQRCSLVMHRCRLSTGSHVSRTEETISIGADVSSEPSRNSSELGSSSQGAGNLPAPAESLTESSTAVTRSTCAIATGSSGSSERVVREREGTCGTSLELARDFISGSDLAQSNTVRLTSAVSDIPPTSIDVPDGAYSSEQEEKLPSSPLAQSSLEAMSDVHDDISCDTDCSAARLQCDKCGFQSMSRRTFSRHACSEIESLDHSCELCDQRFRTIEQSVKHCMQAHKQQRTWLCDKCGWSAPQESIVKAHTKQQHSSEDHDQSTNAEGCFKCPQCPCRFSCPRNLKRHMGSHVTARATFKCDTCSSEYVRLHQLVKHSMRAHGQRRQHPCPHCRWSFPQRGILDYHVRTHDRQQCRSPSAPVAPSAPPAPCDICGKLIKTKKWMAKHRLQHEGSRTHQCKVCGKGFLDEQRLLVHGRTHTDPSKFLCDHCGRRFRLASSLARHVISHSGRRAFRCDTCGKAFFTSFHLAVHAKIHSDERAFLCSVCGVSFRQSSHLKTHMKRHEPGRDRRRGRGDTSGATSSAASRRQLRHKIKPLRPTTDEGAVVLVSAPSATIALVLSSSSAVHQQESPDHADRTAAHDAVSPDVPEHGDRLVTVTEERLGAAAGVRTLTVMESVGRCPCPPEAINRLSESSPLASECPPSTSQPNADLTLL